MNTKVFCCVKFTSKDQKHIFIKNYSTIIKYFISKIPKVLREPKYVTTIQQIFYIYVKSFGVLF